MIFLRITIKIKSQKTRTIVTIIIIIIIIIIKIVIIVIIVIIKIIIIIIIIITRPVLARVVIRQGHTVVIIAIYCQLGVACKVVFSNATDTNSTKYLERNNAKVAKVDVRSRVCNSYSK